MTKTLPSQHFRVLYVGALGPADTSTHRRWAIERLGHEVIEFNTAPYQNSGGALLRRMRIRTLSGWAVHRLNCDLMAAVLAARPSIVWFDKAVLVSPSTVRKLRAIGIFTVHFNVDNPFGPRGDPGWRLFLGALQEYDLHVVPRGINLDEYRCAGARDVRLMYFAYEPTLHFPPPGGWSDTDRPIEVAFIGHPHDNRADFLVALWERHGIAVRVWGNLWENVLSKPAREALWQGGPLWNDAYRQGIWRARICLSFITHSNCDDVAHKSFEIAACGAFLLAEDTPGHRAHFVEGEEAVFFRSVEDCAALIRRCLDDEPARSRIALAGRRRAELSGYSNDARIAEVFRYVSGQFALVNRPLVR